ncbi:hypothetical protein RIR_e65286_A0A2N1NQQ5_9GLOM [Rhizophagus irregularis DAOM 181602=DAOM 197198]|uniref:Uncharacterized protein n=1 Tax=Rhizophagus irregularis (strain DAOM 181602 / DAOM 197198 / MUCL 43194) TaxID=747089 RepID=U9UTQ0_RHIID|nr:hypothetical protein RIR_e65286_A0A2N1NQQ5_9GLOM [Rhizophagus irregularis DAOM 181602=DAOM 197198]
MSEAIYCLIIISKQLLPNNYINDLKKSPYTYVQWTHQVSEDEWELSFSKIMV